MARKNNLLIVWDVMHWHVRGLTWRRQLNVLPEKFTAAKLFPWWQQWLGILPDQLVISLNGLVAYRDLFCVDRESGLLVFCLSLCLFWLKSIKNLWSQSRCTAHWDLVEINHNSIKEGHGVRGPLPSLKKGLQDSRWSLRFKGGLGMGLGKWEEGSGAPYVSTSDSFVITMTEYSMLCPHTCLKKWKINKDYLCDDGHENA